MPVGLSGRDRSRDGGNALGLVGIIMNAVILAIFLLLVRAALSPSSMGHFSDRLEPGLGSDPVEVWAPRDDEVPAR